MLYAVPDTCTVYNLYWSTRMTRPGREHQSQALLPKTRRNDNRVLAKYNDLPEAVKRTITVNQFKTRLD